MGGGGILSEFLLKLFLKGLAYIFFFSQKAELFSEFAPAHSIHVPNTIHPFPLFVPILQMLKTSIINYVLNVTNCQSREYILLITSYFSSTSKRARDEVRRSRKLHNETFPN